MMDKFQEMKVFAAVVEAGSFTGAARGLLKANVPVSFGLMHLAPLWPARMARYPGLALDVTLSDRVADLVEEGFDLAVRIGQLPASSLIGRRLASTRLVLCASPAYLRARGEPTHPDQLPAHDVISYSLFSAGEHWSFSGPGGEMTVKVAPRMRTNSGDTCRAAALRDQGRLKEIMPDYRSGTLGIHAVCPSRKFLAPKVRVAIDFLAEAFARPAWGE